MQPDVVLRNKELFALWWERMRRMKKVLQLQQLVDRYDGIILVDRYDLGAIEEVAGMINNQQL